MIFVSTEPRTSLSLLYNDNRLESIDEVPEPDLRPGLARDPVCIQLKFPKMASQFDNIRLRIYFERLSFTFLPVLMDD